MRVEDIKARIRQCAGIAEFNAMQTAVSASDARRIVLLSPTGSGKTLAFITAVLKRMTKLDCEEKKIFGVIIAPTRELVRQIADVARPVGTAFGLKTLSVYGGNAFSVEEASIRGETPSLLIATPGRLLDHIKRGTVDVGETRAVVFDEYDKTLELGFWDEIRQITRYLSQKLKRGEPDFVMVTSATPIKDMPDFVDVEKAELIDFTPVNRTEARLQIVGVPSHDKDKIEVLAALVRSIAAKGQIIVFVNHRESADRIGDYLSRQKISNVVYHGGLDQQQREIAIAKFASRAAKVLVATDLAGRGIDIEGVEAVIHYHAAADEQIWIHRNGRTARVDRTGEVFVITGPEEDVPEFVKMEREFYPDMTDQSPVKAEKSLIYFDRGKRDKISRGDIAGFVMKKAGVKAEDVGKITVGNSYSLVAVAPEAVWQIMDETRQSKLKNVKVRASLIK